MDIKCACKQPDCKTCIYFDGDIMNVRTKRYEIQVIYLDKENIEQLIEELNKLKKKLIKKSPC